MHEKLQIIERSVLDIVPDLNATRPKIETPTLLFCQTKNICRASRMRALYRAIPKRIKGWGKGGGGGEEEEEEERERGAVIRPRAALQKYFMGLNGFKFPYSYSHYAIVVMYFIFFLL